MKPMNLTSRIQKIKTMLPPSVRLMAVTKTRSIEEINEAASAGIQLIGENRLKEAADKFPFLNHKVEKHFIGRLQTNKVREAVRLFDAIQSVDRLKLAEKINSECEKQNKTMPIFIQVNTSNEPQKGGVEPRALRELIKEVQCLKRLNIIGLMTMAMDTEDTGQIRECFRRLNVLLNQIKEDSQIDATFIKELSMGMSNDYQIAIEEGATLIRIGSKLFKN